jgi:uncharacterized Zn-finger protein
VKQEADVNQVKCQYCEEMFASNEELSQHMKRNHLDSRKNFKCNHCGKAYTQSSSLGFHKRKIHGTETKKEQLLQPKTETVYETEVYNQIYQCHRCNKQFSRPSSLKQHYLVHKEIKVNYFLKFGSAKSII